MSEGRVPWKESNLALIGSDLDHKIKEAAAAGEEQWADVGTGVGLKIWRIEQFRVVPWPEEQYGKFHKGDSYIVLNTYQRDGEDTLLYDVHMWIGSESSQDEYGTAAYKMVEADDSIGGAAIQHREVQGHESPLFQSYFEYNMTYLEGGVESGFNIVEPTKDNPHLYRIKGTQKGMSMGQLPLKKSSLNAGDSFILFANAATVYIWHGASSNPDEKARANAQGEKMCTEGTVVTMDQDQGDADVEEFWAYMEDDGDVAEADEGDAEIENFAPLLFKLSSGEDEEPEQIAKGDSEIPRFGRPATLMDKSLLSDDGVFLLDAGWEVYLWMGSSSDKSNKLAGMMKADSYCKDDPRTVDLPLTIVKSGFEDFCPSFQNFFE